MQRPPPTSYDVLNPESESDVPNATDHRPTGRTKRRRPSYDDLREDMQQFKAEIRDLLSKISTDVAEVKAQNISIQETFSNIQETNEEIRMSIQFVTKQYDEIKLKIDKIEKTKQDQHEKNLLLEEKIEELERMSCLSKLEIRNIPQKDQETKDDLIESVLCISKAINSKLDLSNVRDIYRKTSKNKLNSVVVVDVSTPIIKANVLKAVREYNSKNKPTTLNTSCIHGIKETKPIYVTEYLTFKTKKLFYLTREFAKTENYTFAWTANGKIYLRKKIGDPHLIVRSEKHLESLKERI